LKIGLPHPVCLMQTERPGHDINHDGGNDGDATISPAGASADIPVDQVTISAYPARDAVRLRNAANVPVMATRSTGPRRPPTASQPLTARPPGANQIVHNIVDAAIVGAGDTIAGNYPRTP
jgi:hypothetical protein